jgi:hypothetical protein
MSLSRDGKQRALTQIAAGMLAATSPKEGGPDPQDLAGHAMAYLNALVDHFLIRPTSNIEREPAPTANTLQLQRS